ncbi:MAG: RDD family protein [Cyclobacteriaceae bacterium]
MKTIPVQSKTFEYPCLVTRTIASFIDLFIMGLALLVLWEVNSLYPIRGSIQFVLIILVISYEPLATAAGTTLGQYLMKIKVRRHNDQQKTIGIPHSYLRFIMKLGLNLISFVPMQTRKDRRALHDTITRSIVVNT